MRLTRINAPLPTVEKQARAYRQPGLHLSAIIKDLALTLEPERFGRGRGSSAEDARADLESEPRIWLGSAFDHYLTRVLPHGVRPGAVVVDGVWMTGDFLFIDPGLSPGLALRLSWLVVEEWKLTWMSLRQGIEHPKFRHWLWQLMAYMRAWETVRGRLRVFAVNGDYGPPSPEYAVWELECSELELEENWRMLTVHARRRGWL